MKKLLKCRFAKTLKEEAQPLFIGAIFLTLLGGALGYSSQKLVPFVLSGEMNFVARSLSEVLQNPVFFHVQVIQKLVHAATGNLLISVRTPGVITALIFTFCYFTIVRNWFSRRIAWLATVLIVSSSWFLHMTGVSLPEASYLLLLVPFVCGIYMRANRYSELATWGFTTACIMLLYVPGMSWFVVPALIWQWKQLVLSVKSLSLPGRIIGGLLLISGTAPLVLGAIHDTSLLLTLLNIPNEISSITSAPSTMLSSVGMLLWRSTDLPILGIANLPILNGTMILLFVLGMYHMYRKKNLDRAKLLVASLVFGLIVIGLSGAKVPISILLPSASIAIAAGLALLLQRWLVVFPKNPFARRLALAFLITTVVVSGVYETTRYFIAWPHSDDFARVEKTAQE